MDSKHPSPDPTPESAMASRDSKYLAPMPPAPIMGDIRPNKLALFLPPAIGLWGMAPEQQRQQVFPYSMPIKDGTYVYFSTAALSYLFFHLQVRALESNFPFAERDSITALFIWWIFIIQFRLGMYACLYPFLYACLLRLRSEQWPSRIQVLGSLRAQEMELERGDEVRRSGMIGLLALWLSYTWAGMVLMDAWTAWKEGLGQEEFLREKRIRELEEARLRVVDEEKVECKKGVEQEEQEEHGEPESGSKNEKF